MARSTLINRNIVAERGRTSMRLEPELWDALAEICRRERTTPSELCRRIEKMGLKGGRTSAMRVFVLQYFRAAATEEGHIAAGHGMADHSRSGAGGTGHRAATLPVFMSGPAAE